MVQQVNVDGQIHEFPDEASQTEIQAALDKEEFIQNSMKYSLGGALSVPIQRMGEDVLSTAKNIGQSVVQGVPATLQQVSNDPMRTVRNVAAGLGGIPFNFANTLLNIPAYIAHLGSDTLSQKLKEYTPHIPVEKAQQAWVGEGEQPEDVPIRELFGNAPILFPGAKLAATKIGKPIGKIALNQTLGKVDPLIAAERMKNELELGNKQTQLETAKGQVSTAEEQHQQAVGEAKKNIRMADADLMEYKLNQQNEKINQLKNQSQALQQNLEQMPPAPQQPELGTEHIQRAQNAQQSVDNMQQNINMAEQHHENVKNIANAAEDSIGHYLNKEAVHSVEAAPAINARVNSIENYWSDAYQRFVQKIKDAKFQMPDTAMQNLSYESMSPTELVKAYGNDAFEAIKKGKIDEFIKKQQEKDHPDNPYYKKLLDVAPTTKDIDASDFLLKRKAFRDELFRLKQKANSGKMSVLDEDKARDAIHEGNNIREQIDKTLEQGLGDYKEEFDKINEGYSKEVYPLRENPIVQGAKEGKLPDNIMKASRTNEPGMPLVRQIIKDDPNLLRNIIGQRYVAKPSELYQPNALMREYLNEDPNLQRLIQHRNEANNLMDTAKGQVALAKRKHSEAITESKEAAKESKVKESENKKLLSDYEKQTNEHIETKADIESEINKHESEIQRLKDENIEIQKHMDSIRKESENKKISLQKKMELEKQIKDLKVQLKNNKAKEFESTTRLRKAWLIGKNVYKISKTLGRGF
jgi:hypothetical protein